LSQHEIAAFAYEKAAENPRILPRAQRDLLMQALESRRRQSATLSDLLPLTRRLLEHPAAHEVHQFEALYLQLISGTFRENVIERLSELKTESGEPALRIRRQLLWAMVYQLTGQEAALQREVERMSATEALPLSPGQRTVLAALHTRCGDQANASLLISGISSEELLPEEEKWCANVLK
jgi:hypothetical protein